MTSHAHDHTVFLTEALRAPSAHNAQPWRLARTSENTYELHYNHLDYLPHDPDDRDAYLALGAFYETLTLAAPRHGYACTFEPAFERVDADLFAGVVRVDDTPPGGAPDLLAAFVGTRVTNRRPYRRTAIPPDLEGALAATGCTFVAPHAVAPILRRASMLSWMDRQFVKDLRRWTHFDDRDAPDGMTPHALVLSRVERLALQFAFWRGRLRMPLAILYARRDVALMRAAPTLAVLSADSMEPADLFDAGRRLLRAWTTATAAGYSTHPISVVIDRPETAPQLAAIANVSVPVALFRVGYARRGVPRSNRKPLGAVLESSSRSLDSTGAW
jgi:hypothetical protein